MRDYMDIMQAEYKLLLLEWGFQDYLCLFEEEGIDDESFKLLDKETIEKLFSKCGPRLSFQKKYKDFLANASIAVEEQENDLDQMSHQSDRRSEVSSIVSVISCSQSEPSTSSSYTRDSQQVGDFFILEPDEETERVLKSLENVSQKSSHLKRKSVDEFELPSQKKQMTATESIFSQGLQALLDKSPDGKIVLMHKEKLNNDHRQKLVKIIINELFSMIGTEIRASAFLRVSEEIEFIFPNEKSFTYYIPYIPRANNLKGYGPRGKLWSRYSNMKAALRQANAFKMTKKDNSSTRRNSPEKTELQENQLQFLKVACEPYTKVLESWEGTHRLRRKLYLNEDLSNIYKDFPCLKLNTGIELIETDFNLRFADQVDIVYKNWPNVSNAIVKELHERRINDTNAEYKDTSLHALMMLPFLFSPVTLKKSRKGGHWRPTRTEIQESFFFNVKDYSELERRLTLRRERLYSYDMSMQPSVCVVGELIEPTFYILVNDIQYKVDTSIRALELTFKLYHTFNLDWPVESEHIWLFIEHMVFEMKSGKKCSSTATIMADIKYHLQN